MLLYLHKFCPSDKLLCDIVVVTLEPTDGVIGLEIEAIGELSTNQVEHLPKVFLCLCCFGLEDLVNKHCDEWGLYAVNASRIWSDASAAPLDAIC